MNPPPFHRSPGRPLYLQIRDYLRQSMLAGALPTGGRLPSTRTLANRLGVSRNSVIAAYESLASEGLVRGKVGSGTRVTLAPKHPKPRDLQFLVRESQFPIDPVPLADPDGNPLYLHR